MQLEYVNHSLSVQGSWQRFLLILVAAAVSVHVPVDVSVFHTAHDSVGVVRPGLGLQHFGQPLAFGVGVVVEVEEEEQENHAV